jgi:hypothetical protein
MASDLGLWVEPPWGIEPQTYALRGQTRGTTDLGVHMLSCAFAFRRLSVLVGSFRPDADLVRTGDQACPPVSYTLSVQDARVSPQHWQGSKSTMHPDGGLDGKRRQSWRGRRQVPHQGPKKVSKSGSQ